MKGGAHCVGEEKGKKLRGRELEEKISGLERGGGKGSSTKKNRVISGEGTTTGLSFGKSRFSLLLRQGRKEAA